MIDLGDQLPGMSFDELAKFLRNGQPGSETHERVVSELARRQTIAQIKATEAQILVAHYSFWTVAVSALSAIASALSAYFAYISIHH